MVRETVPRTPQHHPHATQKIPGNRPGVQSEKVFDLGAGDEDGNAVGETHDHRAGNELDRRAQAGRSQRISRQPAMMVHSSSPLKP